MDAILLKTAETFLKLFTNLDPDTIVPIQSDKYQHAFAPASANAPELLNREQFASHLKLLQEVLQSFPVTARQTWSNPLSNQVTIWADSITYFHSHVKDNNDEDEWHYRGEYIFILSMDASGTKIQHVLEFLDSKGTEKLRELMTRARKTLEGPTGQN